MASIPIKDVVLEKLKEEKKKTGLSMREIVNRACFKYFGLLFDDVKIILEKDKQINNLKTKNKNLSKEYVNLLKRIAKYKAALTGQCLICGSTKKLKYHHISYEDNIGFDLCEKHHIKTHNDIYEEETKGKKRSKIKGRNSLTR